MTSQKPTPAKRGRILILCPYPPGTGASQRFRFEQYLPSLRERGFEVEQHSFWDSETWKILYAPGHTPQKVLGVLRGFARRARLLARARSFDHCFIHLEATPIGPPVVEQVLFALGVPVVYDIDDAIFIAQTSRANRLVSALRWRSKVDYVARRSRRVVAVNEYLAEWARRRNPDTRLIPTTIDPEYHKPSVRPPRLDALPILGWTGTQSTLKYLAILEDVLVDLQRTHPFELRVICDVAPTLKGIDRMVFVPWTKASEIEDLSTFDVGLMPVPDEEWSRGKVGFKAIQYSAVGIPPVVSDVGSGREVVEDGVTGFVVSNDPAAWKIALVRLLEDAKLRKQMGTAARDRILLTYAIPAQVNNYVSLFDSE